MNITLDHAQGRVPIAVLAVRGDLDASNYEALIAQARQLVNAGTRDMLLDLSDTTFISSSGLVALHSIAMLLQGRQPPTAEDGWAAIHAVGRDLGGGVQHLKLLSPQPKVERVLEKAGLKQVFEMHTDRATAIASF